MLRSNIEESLPTQEKGKADFFQIVGDGVCIAYHGNEETITFPDFVKELSNYLFFGNSHIKQVHLPQSLQTIGAFTFAFCTQLKEITIPDSVNIIETSAFYFCHQLKYVAFSPLSRLSYLGQDAFLGTHYWEQIESSTTQKDYPQIFKFSSHILLKTQGFQKIQVPKDIKSLYTQAFSGNTELTHIKLPSSVEYLGTSTFQDCSHLRSVILSENLTTIPPYCFRNCTSLQSITLPNSIIRIGKGAFQGCYNLKKVVLSESLEYIDDNVFTGCLLLSRPLPQEEQDFHLFPQEDIDNFYGDFDEDYGSEI